MRDSSICLAASFFGAAIDFGHEEDFVAIAVAERLAHADLAVAVVIVPAVVHEGDAAIDGGADDADAFWFVGWVADVKAAEADGGDFLAGAAEFTIDHVALAGFGAERLSRSLLIAAALAAASFMKSRRETLAAGAELFSKPVEFVAGIIPSSLVTHFGAGRRGIQ